MNDAQTIISLQEELQSARLEIAMKNAEKQNLESGLHHAKSAFLNAIEEIKITLEEDDTDAALELIAQFVPEAPPEDEA